MFTDDTFRWFEGLEINNSKAYFNEHREQYDTNVILPLKSLLTDLSKEFGGMPRLFRPNRDLRFSMDKSPYKTVASGLFLDRDDPGEYYVQVSADGFMAATGFYRVSRDQLLRFRAALATDDKAVQNGETLRAILSGLSDQGFKLESDRLKVTPRGTPKDHPNSDLLTYKSLAVSTSVNPVATLEIDLLQNTSELWRAAEPLLQWLVNHVGLP